MHSTECHSSCVTLSEGGNATWHEAVSGYCLLIILMTFL